MSTSEDWTRHLRNHYWQLRYCRAWNQACRRKQYRRIAAEKKRLQEEGVDPELIRLYCRMLSNLRNPYAQARFEAYAKQLGIPFM